ncbi:MAG: 1-acyl-sn-glycerol-3-phosphate acyltransferase [Ruminococcaceae bacterium]|nr:1-acyl-sn-glycerol-3-phosphate acyltransferase [Oscillospiraceae bacterium]
MREKQKKQSAERLEVLERIRLYEKEGGDSFHRDVEPDPEGHPLTPDEVDYLQVKFSSRFHAFVTRILAAIAQRILRRDLRIRVVGEEHLENLKRQGGGAILTSNHFSKFENLAVKEVADRIGGGRRFWRVIKEFNYFQPGIVGYLMRHCDTLPLSKNLKTMRLFSQAMEELLGRGDLVLVYPEQAMWWNYRKPRPFKEGAFFYAAKHGVPIVPIFVTMEDQDTLDGDGFPKQAYTVHVMPLIYPDPSLSLRENERRMLEENQRLCHEKYKEVYGFNVTYG